MPLEDYAGGASMAGSLLGGPAGLGIAIGANLLGGILSARSTRRRLKSLRAEQLANLAPLQSVLNTRNFGPSQSEGAVQQAVTQRTLGDLAQRGVLNSNVAGPAVASAVAPYEQQRQAGLQGLTERIVAARQAIAEGTSLPGYGAAFGESFGEAGDLVAQASGRAQAAKRKRSSGSPLEDFFMGIQEEDTPGSELGDYESASGAYG